MIVFGATQLLDCSAKFFAFAPKVEKKSHSLYPTAASWTSSHCATALFSSRRRRTGHRMVIRPLHRETPLSELQKRAHFSAYRTRLSSLRCQYRRVTERRWLLSPLSGWRRSPTPHRHFFLKRSGVLFFLVSCVRRKEHGTVRRESAWLAFFFFLFFSFFLSLSLSLSLDRARRE